MAEAPEGPVENDGNLYEPYSRLVKLKILEREFGVPENNSLLRCYQFVSPDTVPMGNFCWNGHCRNCQVTLRRGGRVRVCLSCRTTVRDEDSLEHISSDVKHVLRGVLEK